MTALRKSSVTGLCLIALALPFWGCADDQWTAPYSAPEDQCPSLDDYIEPLLGALSDGALMHVEEAIGSTLTDGQRSDLVGLVIRLANALGPSSFAGLPASSTQPGLGPQLGSALHWAAYDGPKSPYLGVSDVGRGVLKDVEADALLGLLLVILDDAELLQTFAEVAVNPGVDFGEVVLSLNAPDDQPELGLRQLIEALCETVLAPDFEVSALVGLLGLVVDVTNPPWIDAMDALERLLEEPQNRGWFQAVVSSLVEADTEFIWVDLFFDAFTAEGVGGLSTSQLEPASFESSSLTKPLRRIVEFLRDDAEAWRTTVVVLDVLLSPQHAQGVMGDVAQLLSTNALGGLLDGLAAAAVRGCDSP